MNAKNPKEVNESIIALDNYICELCTWGNDLSKLTDAEKVFFYNQELEREINNGGFAQFYYNSSGNYANELIDSLKLIGAYKTADIVKKANDQFLDGKVPKDRNTRLKEFPDLEKRWRRFEKI